jgi:hypothetical protein
MSEALTALIRAQTEAITRQFTGRDANNAYMGIRNMEALARASSASAPASGRSTASR